jgi:hypothetical protein
MNAPLSHREPVTSQLLANVLDAHGGLQNWSRVSSLSAELVLGGPFGRSAAGRTPSCG